jgi:hypothetical protein
MAKESGFDALRWQDLSPQLTLSNGEVINFPAGKTVNA